MGFLNSWIEKRKLSQEIKKAEEIRNVCSQFLNSVVSPFTLEARRSISEWDLSNSLLLNYLGYVAGVLDAAEQTLVSQGKLKRVSNLPTEIAFHQEIRKNLALTAGVQEFLEEHLNDVCYLGGSAIGMLQRDSTFFNAMKMGGQDLMRVGGPNYFPTGLVELGLFSTSHK